MMRTRLMTMLLLLAGMTAGAQEVGHASQRDVENVKIHFNFEDVSGITAKTVGAAKVVEMGKYHVLDLGNASGYLNVTTAAGKILWAFSTLTACGATSGVYSAYRLNAQRIASSTGGFQNETGYSVGTASPKVRWMQLCYFDDGTSPMHRTNFSEQKHGAVVHVTKRELKQLIKYWNKQK